MVSFVECVENIRSREDSERLTVNAVDSFLSTPGIESIPHPTADLLRLWIVAMGAEGYKLTTRRKYFSRIHTLYQEWKSGAGNDPFEEVRGELVKSLNLSSIQAERNLTLVGRVLSIADDDPRRQQRDIFLWLLYNPTRRLIDVAQAMVTDPYPDVPQIADLYENIQNSRIGRSKYLFSLGQGKKRDTQLVREIISDLAGMLRQCGMEFGDSFSRESITAMWVAAAIKGEQHPIAIRSMLAAVPTEYPSLQQIPVAEFFLANSEEMLRDVANIINNQTSEWFVMRMRSRITPERIQLELTASGDTRWRDIRFFYPTRKVSRPGRNGKLKEEDIPWIPRLLFFKVRRDFVAPLFHQIGHMAWCYRRTQSPSSPYSTIPPVQMARFQSYIGDLTPDVDISVVKEEPGYRPGTAVRITGGGFMEGMTGVVESRRNNDGTRTYTLRLTDSEFATWTVNDIAERHIEAK